MNRRSEHPTLSVVLPTRNEEGHIAAFCGAILRAFENLSVAVEVVVVDASDDDTWACLEGVSQNDPRLRAFRQESSGFSGALAEGLCKAQGEWVLAMNSDGNHRIEDAIALFESRVAQQCLVGSRFVQGGGSDMSICVENCGTPCGYRPSGKFFILLPCRTGTSHIEAHRSAHARSW